MPHSHGVVKPSLLKTADHWRQYSSIKEAAQKDVGQLKKRYPGFQSGSEFDRVVLKQWRIKR
jgi:hypothetical protein